MVVWHISNMVLIAVVATETTMVKDIRMPIGVLGQDKPLALTQLR